MKDFRCKFCHRLLAKIEAQGKVEIKCPKCKTMNLFDDEVITIIEIDERYMSKRINQDKVELEIVEN